MKIEKKNRKIRRLKVVLAIMERAIEKSKEIVLDVVDLDISFIGAEMKNGIIFIKSYVGTELDLKINITDKRKLLKKFPTREGGFIVLYGIPFSDAVVDAVELMKYALMRKIPIIILPLASSAVNKALKLGYKALEDNYYELYELIRYFLAVNVVLEVYRAKLADVVLLASAMIAYTIALIKFSNMDAIRLKMEIADFISEIITEYEIGYRKSKDLSNAIIRALIRNGSIKIVGKFIEITDSPGEIIDIIYREMRFRLSTT